MKRGYQPDFYSLSDRVRDPDSRCRKAEKIAEALKNNSRRALDKSICLDIGCSAGLITRALTPLFKKVVGLDYDETALAATNAAGDTEVEFIRGDGLALPLSSSAVDVIVCSQVYEHVPDPERLFDEVYRVLVPGGMVFFSGPNWLFPIEPHYFLPFLHWLPRDLADFYLRLAGKGQHYYEQSTHVWRLRRLMRDFDIRDITKEVVRHRLLPDHQTLNWVVQNIPDMMWSGVVPLLPNFNWILYKPDDGGEKPNT